MESSLRSNRSQTKPSRTASKLAKPGAGATPRPKPARSGKSKSRVDDKIKKRMSMRYADISSPTELEVPAMPSIPQAFGLEPGGRPGKESEEVVRDRSIGTRAAGEERVDDIALLEMDDFDPDAYIKMKLANSTEAELKNLQSSLRNAKDDTHSDLQRNVFKNYAEFVTISKEITVLDNELLELKEALSEFKSMPSLLHISDSSSASTSTLSTYKRSSVADLRIVYFNQMQTLHAQIEGSAKFVPVTPGRHVVGEVEGILALNAATYKAVGRVKFVILDDAVLVARRRRRAAANDGGNANDGKLVAERCWPLQEMLVLDTKDSPSMTNVFKIRHGRETNVYRTETPSEKKSLLHQLRVVAEDFASKKQKEREGEHERRKSLWQGGDNSAGNIPPPPDWMADLAMRAGEMGSGSDGKAKAERDARLAGEWADDLTVSIAHKEWEKATSLIEEGKAKQTIIPPLATKIPPLLAELTSALLSALSLPSNRKTTVVTLISLLLRLKAGPPARSTFLAMRSQVMRNHVRKIKFEGHIGAFVADLAVVYFTGIKHTADWFLASFKENEVASSFIDWVKTELEGFCEMFRKQVYSSDVQPKVVEEAKNITYSQSKKLLEEFGLDFRFLLDEMLQEHPKETLPSSVPFTFRRSVVPPSISIPSHQPIINRISPLPRTPTSATHSAKSLSSASSASAASSVGFATPTSAAPRSALSAASSSKAPSLAYYGASSPNDSAPPMSSRSSQSMTPPSSAFVTSQSQTQNLTLPTVAPLRSRSASNASKGSAAPSSASYPLPSPRSPSGSGDFSVSGSPVRTRTPDPNSGRTRTPDPSGRRTPPPNLSPNRTTRERPPRVPRAPPSPAAAAPPPRSGSRPGSVSHRPPPVAVPQREGMF